MADFQEWVAAQGFDPATLTAEQRTSLTRSWRAEQNPPEPPEPPDDPPKVEHRDLNQIAAEARRENERRQAITELVADGLTRQPDRLNVFEKIGRLAIDGKWDVQKTELELMRAGRLDAPAAFARGEPDITNKVVEAAVCAAGGLDGLEDQYDARTLEAAHKHFRNGLGLGDLVMQFARRGGYSGLSIKGDLHGAMRAAFNPDIRAAGSWGPSTGGGLSGVLSNVANKFLRSGFDAVETTWRAISSIRSVADFKAITTYSLTGGLTYDKVPPGGEIKHGQLGAETYTNQADTYGKMIGIDRRDLINDDLGALTQVSRRLGRGGAMKINDVFWTVFLNNSSFFTAGRNNVSTGAGSALSLAGLDAANAKFLTQTDPDGYPLGVMPKILLAPPALWSTASTLMSSTSLVSGATTTPGTPSNNIWAGMFRVLSSAYMQNSSYTGNSSAAWYLLADPADMSTIEVAFLNGQESPTVETADADFGMLGIALRGYHDFGVAFQEYRAGVRSAGS